MAVKANDVGPTTMSNTIQYNTIPAAGAARSRRDGGGIAAEVSDSGSDQQAQIPGRKSPL